MVTASRAEEDAATVSANVTVIDADDIAVSGSISVVDLLKNEAGLNVADWSGVGRTASVDIRGFGETGGSNTLVVVDGRRVNPPDMSGVDWTTIPLDRIERVEIIRGGGSVLYGNNATGGVINIITKKGAEEHTASTSTTYGSYEYFNQAVGVAGSSENLTYNLHGNYTNTEGYRDNNDFFNKSLGLNLGYAQDQYAIDISAGVKEDEYGMPGDIIEGEESRRSTNNPDDFAESRDQYVQITPRFMFTDGSEASIALSARKLESEGEMSGWTTEQDLYNYNMSPKYDSMLDLLGFQHKIVVGLDYEYSKLKASFRDDTRKQYGFYIHDKIQLTDRVYMNVGYRGTRVSYDLDNGSSDSSNIHSATGGLTYNYAPGSKVFASVERGFRTVSLDELGGENFDELLDSQTSIHYQTGIKHRLGPYTEVGVTVFQIDTKDEILFNPALPSFFGGQNDNYGRTRRRGSELEIAVSPHEMVRLFGNYTYMTNELRGGELDGNDIPGVADHIATAGVTVFPVTGLSFDFRGRWVDGKTMISDWENEIDDNWEGGDYLVFDTMASYSRNPFIINVGIKNLFNEKYSEYGTYYGGGARNIYPSPERNYFGEVRISHEF